MQTVNERIAGLREKMKASGLDAYIIPSSDPHQSEYVADHWKSRTWLSGFTGSAGLLVVTANHAGLWTDSRYFLQAEDELSSSEVVLQKQKVPYAPEHLDWLRDNLLMGCTIGLDGYLFSHSQLNHIIAQLGKSGLKVDYTKDLIQELWQDRPALPQSEVFELDESLAGKSRGDKLEEIRQQMRNQGATCYVISTLDDIAWTLNIRASDVEYNPVCIAYLLIEEQKTTLFVEETKIKPELQGHLSDDGVALKPYQEIESSVSKLPKGEKLLVDGSSLNARLFEAIPKDQSVKGKNIICQLKALKNPTEVAHIKTAMVKDAVALCRFYRWLEGELEAGNTISEAFAAEKLAGFRAQQEGYFGESFGAIVGYNSNGAIVHYSPEEGKCADIRKKGVLLLDSGGQYQNGTTDITRTTALSTPRDELKTNYTLVLKGHIAVARIQFPKGTTGVQLDTLARMHLWQAGLNYGHGTGHGVGFFLNVHEPPQGITPSPVGARGTTPFQPGMFTSNEPGFYKTGEYGIRIENLVLCVEGEETEYGKFYKFDTLTLFPIDTSLIKEEMLTQEEVDWLNNYHQEVYEKVSPALEPEEKKWLEDRCRAV